MANMSVFYNISKHATALPSNVLAGGTYGGHTFSVQLKTDTDNGNLIALGDYIGLDLYDEATVTKFEGKIVYQMGNGNYLVQVLDPGDAVLVYSVPVGAEEYNSEFKAESSLYNKAGDTVRTYSLVKYDTFEVSVEGFDGTPEVGKSISGVSEKKLTVG
jgi:hypothetical protein